MNGEEGGRPVMLLRPWRRGLPKETPISWEVQPCYKWVEWNRRGWLGKPAGDPYPQDKTVVIGNNDGGTGVMTNTVAVYVGTKTNTGSEVDKAGLTNGVVKFVTVTGNTKEITNNTPRATAITNGTRFTLSDVGDHVLASRRWRVESARSSSVLLCDNRSA